MNNNNKYMNNSSTFTCPLCGFSLYEKNRREETGGTFIEIRCSNCNYFNYKTIPSTNKTINTT